MRSHTGPVWSLLGLAAALVATMRVNRLSSSVAAAQPDADVDTTLPSWRSVFTAWFFGLLLLAAVISVVLHGSELRAFGRLLRQVRPMWLVAALSVQGLTYVCAAGVWWLALDHEHHRCPLLTLVPTALAMLFANQVFPSAGVAGSLVVVRALRRRHVPAHVVMGALIVGLITTYAAYLIAVVLSLVLLRVRHAVHLWLLLVSGGFALASFGLPAAVIWYRESLAPKLPAWIARLPAIGSVLDSVAAAPGGMLHDRSLFLRAVTLQFTEILLDAGTLFVLLLAIGSSASPSAVFASFVMASAVSTVVPVPLGLGTFEASLITMLRLVGVPIEPALTATLLLRGFTLWLPMLPGLVSARREL
jgi:uncharacterized protein (TIRG00374 family)